MFREMRQLCRAMGKVLEWFWKTMVRYARRFNVACGIQNRGSAGASDAFGVRDGTFENDASFVSENYKNRMTQSYETCEMKTNRTPHR